VTLARFKRPPITKLIPYLEANAGFQTSPFEINQVVLYRTHLAEGGADYEKLATYPEFS
jgi:2'-5' RNA ligase